jgi:polyisoprenyl-phosphate glycosyltransferase
LGRRVDRKDSFLKKTFSKLYFNLLGYLAGFEYDSTVGNFGIYSRKSINAINNMRESIRSFHLMLQWAGFKQAKIDIQHDERAEGKSTYDFFKLVNLAINVILSYSDKPIRLTIQLGVLIATTAFLFAFFVLYRYFGGYILVPGYSSIIFSIWFLSGCIIMTLGVIGLYIGKIFEASKQRPIYIVDTIHRCT